MIFHLFKAANIHHVPHMIEEILKCAEHTNNLGAEEHFFLLRLNDKDYRRGGIPY